MTIDRDTLVRLLRGELSEDEASSVRKAIESDRSIAAQYESVRRLTGLLREGVADSFAPYFSERVLKKLMSTASNGRTAFYDSLQWVFLRLAAASLLVVIGLGAYSALDARESELSANTIEAVFGLPTADLENLFYLQGI